MKGDINGSIVEGVQRRCAHYALSYSLPVPLSYDVVCIRARRSVLLSYDVVWIGARRSVPLSHDAACIRASHLVLLLYGVVCTRVTRIQVD